jgi:hypothetical protein
LLVTAQAAPTALAADGTYIYWGYLMSTADTAIRRYKLDGTDSGMVVPSAQPLTIATDGAYVYWSEQSDRSVAKAPVMGAAMPTPIVNQSYAASQVYVQGGVVVWATPMASSITESLSGLPYINANTVTAGHSHFTLDGGFVYWADATIGQIEQAPLPLGMSKPTNAIFASSTVVDLVADSSLPGYVYFTTSAMLGSLYKVAKDGSTPANSPPLTSVTYPDALLVDDKYVYWTEYSAGPCTGTGKLKALPVGGASAPIHLANVQGCGPMAQDTTHLYFADGPQIWQVTKP